jgi:hypothetical protein
MAEKRNSSESKVLITVKTSLRKLTNEQENAQITPKQTLLMA